MAGTTAAATACSSCSRITCCWWQQAATTATDGRCAGLQGADATRYRGCRMAEWGDGKCWGLHRGRQRRHRLPSAATRPGTGTGAGARTAACAAAPLLAAFPCERQRGCGRCYLIVAPILSTGWKRLWHSCTVQPLLPGSAGVPAWAPRRYRRKCGRDERYSRSAGAFSPVPKDRGNPPALATTRRSASPPCAPPWLDPHLERCAKCRCGAGGRRRPTFCASAARISPSRPIRTLPCSINVPGDDSFREASSAAASFRTYPRRC